jgi:hypothetical protein
MHVEVGGSSGSQVSLNDSDIRGLISKGSGAQMSFNEWYGASSGPALHYFDLPNATFGSERTLVQLQPTNVGSGSSTQWMRLPNYADDAFMADFSHDGTKMFVMGYPATSSNIGDASMYRYDMSTAWDITTAVGQTGLSGTTNNGYVLPRTISSTSIAYGGYSNPNTFKFFNSGQGILISYSPSGGRGSLIYGSMTTNYDPSTATWSTLNFNINYMSKQFNIAVTQDLKTIMFSANYSSSVSPFGRLVRLVSSSANAMSSGTSAYTQTIYDYKVYDSPTSSSNNAGKTFIFGLSVDMSSTSTYAGGTIITGYSNQYDKRYIHRYDDTFDGSSTVFNTSSTAGSAATNALTPSESDAYKAIRRIVINSAGTKGLAQLGSTDNVSGDISSADQKDWTYPQRIVNVTW